MPAASVQTTADISLLRISMKPETDVLLCQNYNSVYVFTIKLRSEEGCVTILKTAARETIGHLAGTKQN